MECDYFTDKLVVTTKNQYLDAKIIPHKPTGYSSLEVSLVKKWPQLIDFNKYVPFNAQIVSHYQLLPF